MRNLVFISHANPEDNEFTRWLGLQLTKHGYAVWSDVTKLIGGESFWGDIEDAIRTRTTKFLFVLSRASNGKPGALDELHLAKTVAKTIGNSEGVKDFVVPLRHDCRDQAAVEPTRQIHTDRDITHQSFDDGFLQPMANRG